MLDVKKFWSDKFLMRETYNRFQSANQLSFQTPSQEVSTSDLIMIKLELPYTKSKFISRVFISVMKVDNVHTWSNCSIFIEDNLIYVVRVNDIKTFVNMMLLMLISYAICSSEAFLSEQVAMTLFETIWCLTSSIWHIFQMNTLLANKI